jgi:hypothetical protein
MQGNKKYAILLRKGLKMQVSEHGGFGYIDYMLLPKGSGRPKDWDLVNLALMGASYDTLFEAAELRPLSPYIRHESNGYDKARSNIEALKRRVERATKQAEDIKAEITRQTGLTLKKASAEQIAKQMKFLADADKYPLPEC